VSATEAERELLRDTVGQLLAEHCTPERVAAAAESETGWDPVTWGALHETGLTLVGSAEEAGGSGGDLSEAADIAVAAGAAAAPVPLAETLAAGVVLARAGLSIPDGPLTLAMTDPDAGDQRPAGPERGAVLLRRCRTGGWRPWWPWARVMAGTGCGSSRRRSR
jgi:acyl-CoA dehydrogenase